eukprot:COSAG05_NODE_8274_length_719_cov_1.270968_1_plen_59_part_10
MYRYGSTVPVLPVLDLDRVATTRPSTNEMKILAWWGYLQLCRSEAIYSLQLYSFVDLRR